MDKAEFVVAAKEWAKEMLIEYNDDYVSELIEDLLHTEGEEEVLAEDRAAVSYKLTFVLELLPHETVDKKLHRLIFAQFGFGVKSYEYPNDSDYELLAFIDMEYEIISEETIALD